jgi:hypothetical protein
VTRKTFAGQKLKRPKSIRGEKGLEPESINIASRDNTQCLESKIEGRQERIMIGREADKNIYVVA